MMKPYGLFLPWWIVLAEGLGISASHAEVTLDGSLGPSGALPGPEFQIPAEVGQLQGANLFHSFGAFNLNAAESATFSGPNSVQNILGRVTGGSASSIDGLIRSTIPGADLYLINPFGILFGPNASLDVQGSFHATTADYLRLQDGARFNAVPSSADVTLTVAPPEAFGFLGDNPASISVVGDASDNPPLEVPAGETLSLIGGDIEVQGRTVAAEDGRINIASVGSQGEVKVSDPGIALEGFTELGDIQISQAGLINTSGPGGGAIFIRGGEFVIEDGSDLFADTELDGEGIGIDIDLTGKLTVQEDSRITAEVLESGTGTGGDVTIRAGSLEVLDRGLISATTFGEGSGGNVWVEAERIRISGAEAPEAFTGIAAQTEGEGNAGDLTVKAGRLEVLDGGVISASTFGEGNGGSLRVEAEQIRLSGAGAPEEFTGIATQTESQGDAGDLTVKADSLEVLDRAQINAKTFGDGRGGKVVITADNLSLHNGGAITTLSEGSGLAGDIAISVDGLFKSRGGQVTTESSQSSGGKIEITADTILSTDGALVSSSVFGGEQSQGGVVTVNSETLLLSNSRIEAKATQGRGGFITINIEVFLHDGKTRFDVLDASSNVLGNAGTVAVNTPEQDLSASLEHLPTPFLNAAALLQDRCSTRTAETASTFIIREPNVQTGPGEAWGDAGASILPELPSLKDTHPAPDRDGRRTSQADLRTTLKAGCAGT